MRVENQNSNRSGQSLLEYVVLLAVVALAIVGVVAAIGHNSSNRLADANAVIQQQGGSGSTAPSGLPSGVGSSSGSGTVPTSTTGDGSSTSQQSGDAPRH